MGLWWGLGGSLILGRIGGVSPFLRKVTTASGATAVQVVAKEGRRNKISSISGPLTRRLSSPR